MHICKPIFVSFDIYGSIKLIFENWKEKHKKLKIANCRRKDKGEKTEGQKRGKNTDKNSRSLGYCPICSSNKRFLVINPINFSKI